MEDNGAAAAAAAPATSMPAEKRVAVIQGDAPPEPAAGLLPCGPRKTGLHLFVMNIRCACYYYYFVARAQLHCTVTIGDENMPVLRW